MSQSETILRPRTAGNENTGLIKLIAIFFMLVDHACVVLFTKGTGVLYHSAIYSETLYNSLRALGRFGMPLFCWGIVVGTEYTRNIWKYLLRILAVGVISQPCYMYALNHGPLDLNVFPTLGLCVLAIAGIKWKRYGSQVWLPILAVLVSMLVQMDYGWVGVCLILVLYACRKSRGALAAGFVAYCLFMGRYYGSFSTLFGVTSTALRIPLVRLGSPRSALAFGDLCGLFFQLEFWAVCTLPLIVIPMKRGFRVPKWIGYSAYPVHLAVLAVIRHWDEITAFFAKLTQGGLPG